MGFDEDDQHKIGISVRECMVNAVVHGNRYNSRKKVHGWLYPQPRARWRSGSPTKAIISICLNCPIRWRTKICCAIPGEESC